MATLIIQDAFRPYYSGRDGTTRKTARHSVPKEADAEGSTCAPRCEDGTSPMKAAASPSIEEPMLRQMDIASF